ncbi:MAG: DUF1016 family protein [Paludibacteraceae bacterium]|nr:DUF1016 family protein [Paludibacteraceae bacterium]
MADIEKLHPSEIVSAELLGDLRKIIDSARSHVAATANYELTAMYWHIGDRINRDVLNNERAEYGKQIVATVARQLQEEYGTKGFEERTIRRMMQFALQFPDFQIVSPLVSKLSWTHFLIVMPIKDSLQREFYLTMAATERWSKRTLQAKIDGMLYERTAIATKPEELIKQELADLRDNETLSPDLVFKSPYFLEFTGLKGMYSEKSLEDSLVAHLEQFIMELGNGFTFVERQKRMIIDGEDFYLDLLFYHRKLHRLIAIDLKLGRFKAQYKGQMELYLRWLEQNEMQPGEESPLGLLLCTEGSEEQINLLQLDKSGIRIAQYLTELPSKEVLLRQLQKSLAAAKELSTER